MGKIDVQTLTAPPRRRSSDNPVPSVEAPGVEDLLRELAPQVLGMLVRRYGRFDACEDAVQEALLAGVAAVARGGGAGQPRAWFTVASAGWSTGGAARAPAVVARRSRVSTCPSRGRSPSGTTR